ncbi:hypothetical protein L6452_19374 [Arctium lappa]|uniref:Uncharacterized protein n=1 Tax=Arctium lappa TaxID=4217 RepID=A0ACB9B974_ARCLA|nr:hypothetical protein L6452_19374 [Arctium lappa]
MTTVLLLLAIDIDQISLLLPPSTIFRMKLSTLPVIHYCSVVERDLNRRLPPCLRSKPFGRFLLLKPFDYWLTLICLCFFTNLDPCFNRFQSCQRLSIQT